MEYTTVIEPKDERLVIGVSNNRDLDRLLRLRSITIYQPELIVIDRNRIFNSNYRSKQFLI